MHAYDMSRYQRVIGNDGRIRGSWKVSRTDKTSEMWINAIDVVIYDETHSWGRAFYFGELTASYKDGKVKLSKHMIASDKLYDVEEVWDEMLETIKAVAETEWLEWPEKSE